MLKNYLITAFRNFKRNRAYSFLNIFGLAIGLGGCLFVFTIIRYERSFDNWHTKKDRIYRVVSHYNGDNGMHYTGILPYPTGDAILRDIPDFEKVVQFHGPEDEKLSLTDQKGEYQVFRQERVLYTDENFFDVLDFTILRGASPSSLKEPYKAYLTEKMVLKYFGAQDPIGKVIRLNNKHDLEIVGVVETPGKNTSLPFEVIISLPTLRLDIPDVFKDNWGMTWAYSTYVLTRENADVETLEGKLTQMRLAYDDDEDNKGKLMLKLQPLEEIHNDERYGRGKHYVTPSLMVWAFVILGLLLLGTACLNFINLSTAQAIRRSREIGVRKTLGSMKHQLIVQFLTETFTIVLVAVIIGFTLGQVLISEFNSFLSEIEYNLSYTPEVIVFALILALVVTFLAGFYPAMILSGYKPVEALYQRISVRKGSGNFNLRRALVITQFVFTNVMLIATIIIAAQMNYVKNKDLGFNYNRVVTIDFPDGAYEKLEAIAGEYRTKSYVEDVTRGYTTPISGSNWTNSYYVKGGEYIDGNNANMKFGDRNYLDFYDIQILSGRNISEQIINDSTIEALVNEKLITTLGWNTHEESIGQWIDLGYLQAKIIGIIEDYNVQTLQTGIKPSLFAYQPDRLEQLSIRLKTQPTSDMVTDIETTFRRFYPNDLFEFEVLENEIQQYYRLEDMLHQIVWFVSILSILLSVMGLYGLVSFMANKNSKNIGIRKVFGATVGSILRIFAKEYVVLLSIAFVVSAPLAYWLTRLWINEFAYRIDLSMMYFAIAFLLTFFIAVITVGYRSYVAASANPVKSLRYE